MDSESLLVYELMRVSHKSIIAYLNIAKLPNSAVALRGELSIGDTFDDATSKKYEGLLEKKWTSVVRLQKKVSKRPNRHHCWDLAG